MTEAAALETFEVFNYATDTYVKTITVPANDPAAIEAAVGGNCTVYSIVNSLNWAIEFDADDTQLVARFVR